MRNQPLVPTLLIVMILTVVLFGLGGILIYDRLSSEPAAPESATQSATSPLSEFEAERVQAVVETQAPPVSTFAETERGIVSESTGQVIRLEGSESARSWPVAENVEAWKNGEKISVADIDAGETVSLRIKNFGSPRDGWIPTVTRINVDPPPAGEATASGPDKTGAEAGDAGQGTAAGLRAVSYVGEVKDIDDRTITIIDSLDDTLTFAIASAAAVRRDGTVGPLKDLNRGDKVKLVGQRVGGRSDGQTVLIERIEVQ